MKLKFNLNNFSLPLLLWALLYTWRPWMLGFYYDDWGYLVAGVHQGAPFSVERLAWFLKVAIDRPMAGINHWFFTSLLGDNPVLWHGLLALIFLLFMLVFYRFLKALFRLFDLSEQSPAITVATAFWPCLPWLFGWSAWACTTGFIFMTLFAFCGERLLSGWSASRQLTGDKSPDTNWQWLPPVLAFAILCFYYEQFYLQFFLFLALAWLAGAARPFLSKKVLLPLTGLMLVQIAALAWNRLHSHRGVQEAFFKILSSSLIQLPNRLLKSTGSMKGLIIVAVVILMALLGRAFWRWWKAWKTTPAEASSKDCLGIRPAMPGAMLVCMVGMLMCITFYAAGGYEILTLGTTSRTANGLTFWLVSLVALLLHFAFSINREHKVAVVQTVTIVLLIAGLGVANIHRTLEWSRAWRMSQDILRSLPPTVLSQLAAPGAGIIYDGPFRYKQVPFFGSPIALASALRYQYPALARPKGSELLENPFSWAGLTPVLICSRAQVYWNGSHVEQIVSTLPHRAPVSALWLWKVQEQRLVRLTPPATFRCDYKSGDDYRFQH
jgi:hypothetical protein